MGQPVAYVPSGVPQPGNDQSWVAWLPAALFIPVSIPIPATGSWPWHPYLPPSLPCRHPCADGRPRPASFCIPLAAVSSRCSPSLRITPVNGGHCRGVRLSLEPRGESSLGGWRGFKRWPGRGIRAKGVPRGRKGIMKNIKVYRMRLGGHLKRGLGYQGFIKVACGMTFNIMFLMGFY